MMKCPFCRAEVPDDSYFCDQCGKEFKFCPECGKPKTGTMCAACGVPLVSAKEHFAAASDGAAVCAPLSLVGEGLTLELTEGDFGRTGGIWPAFSAFPYISGRHGHIGRQGSSWTIVDFGSTNGTILNGKRLGQDAPAVLKAGDKVIIATSEFVVNETDS